MCENIVSKTLKTVYEKLKRRDMSGQNSTVHCAGGI